MHKDTVQSYIDVFNDAYIDLLSFELETEAISKTMIENALQSASLYTPHAFQKAFTNVFSNTKT